ncbi:MAG: L-seryl-tRNA(Sec) selenium transferase [Syntrophomonadaceae bacterium]|nr:L-seryl-tRNA(Sec) selenium transferase [Syntrophomonadaceae bacterium]
MSGLQNIPSVDEVLSHTVVKDYLKDYNRDFIVSLIRKAIDEVRRELLKEKLDNSLTRAELVDLLLKKIEGLIEVKTAGTLCKVINGTGVVLHTNMGRAPLGKQAIDYMVKMAANYNNLELDLLKGERGSRYSHVEELLIDITGAEAALVVNNNAAAVMLGLNTIAKGKEVIVSRGQLVEIGGAFRIPEVMKLSGARLVEVGTTNKTYISDYEEAINEETGLLFTAHTSNYKIIGFTEDVKIEELVRLGRAKDLPVMYDLGSGVLCDLSKQGLNDEPTVQQCVESGADIIMFSGDKLLGGPQAGIIVGKKKYIEAMKKNQLLRALRVDKLTIAALEGTLVEYLSGKPQANIPVLAMLSIDQDELYHKAESLLERLQNELEDNIKISKISLVTVKDVVGGGAYPTHHIPGYGVEIKFEGINLGEIAKKLRVNQPALIGRLQDNSMLISVRTLFNEDIEQIPNLIKRALS